MLRELNQQPTLETGSKNYPSQKPKNQKVNLYQEEPYCQQVYDGLFLHRTVQL
jgi:hypothetical protein